MEKASRRPLACHSSIALAQRGGDESFGIRFWA
jgi:hypothetical protein